MKKYLYILLILISVLVFVLFIKEDNIISDDLLSDSVFNEMILYQEQVDDELLAKFNEGIYTLENPLVVLDPYNQSPLTALVLFETDDLVSVSVFIGEDINIEFDDISYDHIIPIYGLYAGVVNEVKICANECYIIEIETSDLPDNYKDITIDTILNGDYSSGINFVSDSIGKYGFDMNGDIRWYTSVSNYISNGDCFDYKDDLMIFSLGSGHQGYVELAVIDMLGKVLDVFSSDYGVHHEIAVMDNGNLLVAGSNTETLESIEDFIYEIDITNGSIVNTLDLKDVFDRNREGTLTGGDYFIGNEDWFHLNSIEYIDGSIIISGNFQSTVASLSWPSGEVEWILNDGVGYSEEFEPYILESLGDFSYSYNQHAVAILPDYDNNNDTMDILLFDNGGSRCTLADICELYSRMVHYRINEVDMKVSLIFEYGKERFDLYSQIMGDADLLENGNMLGTFPGHQAMMSGSYESSPVVVEIDSLGNVVFEASIINEDSFVYAVDRLNLYRVSNEYKLG